MIDTAEKFWVKAPTFNFRHDGMVDVHCGDCPWGSTIPRTKAEAMFVLGAHYLSTSRHDVVDSAE